MFKSIFSAALPIVVVVAAPEGAFAQPAVQSTLQVDAAGTVSLSGELADGIVEVDRGGTITIRIHDGDGYAVRALLEDPDGTTVSWTRKGSAVEYTFRNVAQNVPSSIAAVSETEGGVVYGPVVVVKPKG